MFKNDPIARRVLAFGISACGILLCGTLLVSSIQKASADEPTAFPTEFTSFPGDERGDIMMDYTSVHVPSQDKTYYEVMVWNTSTGQSKLYFYSYNDKKFVAYEDNVQLPRNPME